MTYRELLKVLQSLDDSCLDEDFQIMFNSERMIRVYGAYKLVEPLYIFNDVQCKCCLDTCDEKEAEDYNTEKVLEKGNILIEVWD